MRFRTPIVFGLSAAILVGCGGPATVSYNLKFDTQDPGLTQELSAAAIRVMGRRLERLGTELRDQKIVKEGDSMIVTITVSDAAAAEALTNEMTAPFDLQIMASTDNATEADATVEGFGSFVKTGVSGKDLEYVVSKANGETGGAMVRIPFTKEGEEKMRAVFEQNVGKNLGMFVRGKLVSALEVKSKDLPNPLVIDGIPDAELAAIFADDVNVGNHVTVSPL